MVTQEEFDVLKRANYNWHVDRYRSEANMIFAKYNGRRMDLKCGSCIQKLRNWINDVING